MEKNVKVSEELFDLVKNIQISNPTAIFGGSIALNALGLLDRPIHDIDVLFPIGFSMSKNFNFKDIDAFESSETITDFDGVPVQRVGMKSSKTKICVFKLPSEQLQYTEVDFFGLKICVQNPEQAIWAKICYSDKTYKHRKDLFEVFKNLLTNPNGLQRFTNIVNSNKKAYNSKD